MPERGRDWIREALVAFVQDAFAEIHFFCALTPELSRADLRPRRVIILPWPAEAAKRTRLERIVRRLTSDAFAEHCEYFTRRRSNPDQLHRTGSVRLQCCLPGHATADGVQPLSGCTEYVADENRTLRCRVMPTLTFTRSLSGAA